MSRTFRTYISTAAQTHTNPSYFEARSAKHSDQLGEENHIFRRKHQLLPNSDGNQRRTFYGDDVRASHGSSHTVWDQGKDKVASSLSMDVAGAFDKVSRERLLRNLRRRKSPLWITNWVEGFLTETNSLLRFAAFQVRHSHLSFLLPCCVLVPSVNP